MNAGRKGKKGRKLIHLLRQGVPGTLITASMHGSCDDQHGNNIDEYVRPAKWQVPPHQGPRSSPLKRTGGCSPKRKVCDIIGVVIGYAKKTET